MSNKDVGNDTPLTDLDRFARSMFERLGAQPNLFNPFQGLRPRIHRDELELNQRMEAAFSFMRDETTSVEEFQKRSIEAARMLGERMRRLGALPDKHQAKPVIKNSAVRSLPSIKLPIIKPPIDPAMGPLDPPPTLDYSIASARLNTGTSIRILNIDLLEQTDSEFNMYAPITCSISAIDLDENPIYRALSYTWGDPLEVYPSPQDFLPHEAWGKWSWTIMCGGSPISVSTNLYTALLALRWTISSDSTRSQDSVPVWIDALCINQGDVIEKGQQVKMMTRVYKQAEEVHIWLGGEDRFTQKALDVLETFSTAVQTLSDIDYRMLEMHQSRVMRGLTFDYLPIRAILHTEWLSLYAFLTRSWFSRVWVIQEFVMAQKATFMCGLHAFPSDWIEHTVQFLHRSGWIEALRPILCNTSQEASAPPAGKLVKIQTFNEHIVPNQDEAYQRDAQIKFHTGTFMEIFKWKESIPVDSRSRRPLWTTLQLLRDHRATNPRDKVYALMGVSEEFQDPSLRKIPIDYSRSAQDVFIDAARFMVLDSLTLDILCLKEARPTMKGLPSWVPDFSVTSFPNVLSDGHIKSWIACGPFLRPVPKVLTGNALEVMGASIGKISSTNFFPREDQHSDISDLWEYMAELPPVSEILVYDGDAVDDCLTMAFSPGPGSPIREVPIRPVIQQRSEVLWRTLLCNVDPYDPTSTRPAPASHGSVVLDQTLNVALYTRMFAAGVSMMGLSQVELCKKSSEPAWGIHDLKLLDALFNHLEDPTNEFLKVGKIFTSVKFIRENYSGPIIFPPEVMALYKKLEETEGSNTELKVLEEFVAESANSMTRAMDHPKAAVLQKWMGEVCLGRKLFISTKGFLGYTTEVAEPGDEIWLIARCKMPVILRRFEGGYRLIGEAYVHGLMQGQAFATDATSGERVASAFGTIKIV